MGSKCFKLWIVQMLLVLCTLFSLLCPVFADVYSDLSGDGKTDSVTLTWNGRKTVVIDQDQRFLSKWQQDKVNAASLLSKALNITVKPPVLWNPLRAGWGSYLIMVDGDGDGVFGSSKDLFYRVLDVNGDLLPEIEFFSGNIGPNDTVVQTVVNLNGERDFRVIDWQNLQYTGHDEEWFGPGGRFYTNVHGSGFFHNTRLQWADQSIAWENPIAWYDFNQDGFTDMVMRITTLNQNLQAHEGEFAFELNGELSKSKWHSLDCQFTFTAYTPGTTEPVTVQNGLPMDACVDDISAIPVPTWARSLLGPGWQQLGTLSKRVYLPYLDGYKIATDFTGWTGVWLLWDEDDDDGRWEEMFSRKEVADPARWREISDLIGDRVEIDQSLAGQGQYYIGAFDGRMHLYKANIADWNVDYYGHYTAQLCDPILSPPPPVGLLHDIVRYYDTDGNGFIDKIEYGTAKYGQEDSTWTLVRTVNLLDYADAGNPHPDVQPLYNLRVDTPLTGWKVSTWDGNPVYNWTRKPIYDGYRKIKALYEKMCAEQWVKARDLYDAATYLGWNKSESSPECAAPANLTFDQKKQLSDMRVLRGYGSITDAQSLREKYHYGYWLKEKVLQDILDKVDAPTAVTVKKLYYTRRISDLCKMLMDAHK